MAATSASARSIVSRATPIAAPQRSRPSESFDAFGILHRLLDVLDGDQPLQPVVAIDDEQLLDLVLVQDLARRVERRADRHGDQRLARHDVGDRRG